MMSSSIELTMAVDGHYILFPGESHLTQRLGYKVSTCKTKALKFNPQKGPH